MSTTETATPTPEPRTPSPAKIALAIAGPGSALVAAAVLLLATHSQSAPAAASAAAPLATTAAPVQDMASMPGMTVTHHVHHPAATKPAMDMTPSANRKTPYGTQPLAYTVDHGVKVF